MPKPLRIGELVKLPSGKKVRVIFPTVQGRPWSAVQAEHVWHVCREHGLAAQGVTFVFDPVSRHPMRLDQADAEALATALNTIPASQKLPGSGRQLVA